MIDLSQWRASIGSWNFCQRPPRSNQRCSIRSANGCRYHLLDHLFSTTAEKKEIKLLKTAAFLVVFELVFLGLFLSIHILLHYSPVRLTGIIGGYPSFQYTVISTENWLQLEPICFHDNLLLLLLSGDVELNPGPRGALDVLNESDLIDIIDALNEGGFTTPEWYSLGLRLRISHDDLRTIETDYNKVDRCLTECLGKWLSTGKATYAGLAEALEKMGEHAAADHISTRTEMELTRKVAHDHSEDAVHINDQARTEEAVADSPMLQQQVFEFPSEFPHHNSWKSPECKTIKQRRFHICSILDNKPNTITPLADSLKAADIITRATSNKVKHARGVGPYEQASQLLDDAYGTFCHNPKKFYEFLEILREQRCGELAEDLHQTCKTLREGAQATEEHHNTEQDTQNQVHVSPDTINKWLKEGSVELTVTRVTMCGLPGTGKTCAQNLLLNKEALSDDSTQIADRTVRATRVSYDKNNWDEVTRKEMLGRLKDNLLQKEASATISKQKTPTSTSGQTSEHLKQSKISEYTNSESGDNTADSNGIHDDKNITVITEVLKTESVKGFQDKEDWLYIIDSGGQPAYQELLPLFTRAASLNIITIDLSKGLEEELELKYRIDGKSYPCHSKSTQLACFESTISSGAIFKPLIIPGVTDTDPKAKQSRSMHMILGTHYDKEVGEQAYCLYEERLSKFVSSLESYLCKRIIKTPADSVVFYVNSLAEPSEREKYREKVCKAIWDNGSDASCKFTLPIRWFAFELSLPESCVITEEEAISIGGKCEMGKNDTKEALRYLHHVSLVLYYPNLALVFTSPQPILKILSQLLALTYQYYDADKTPDLTIENGRISLDDVKDLRKGFLKENLLLEIFKTSSKVSSEHFKLSGLIDILRQLNIIHSEQNGSYFIPYALPSFKTSDQKFKKEPSFSKPLCILYWTEEGRENQKLPIPQGVFPLAIVYLLNQEEVKISEPTDETYMYRDAMTLLYRRNFLHMINWYSHIEVHYIGPKEDCSDICRLVFKAITDGSTKINIKHDYIHLGFTCKHNKIIIVDEKGNRKTPCSSTELPCSLDDDTYKCWFATSSDCVQGTSDTKEAASQQCTDGPDLPNEVAQDNEEATAITNSAPSDHNTKHQRSWCSYGMILICFGAIIFALLAFITAIMMSTTSLQCLLNRNSFMCTLEKMLSDGAGITLNNDGEKAPHVSLTSPSFSEESLDTTQLADIIQALKNSNYDVSTWHDLCLNLGLNQGTLNTIERDKSDSNERLKTCLHKWLNRVDQVDSKGGATKSSLVRALKSIGQKPVAEKMRN